MSDILNIQPNAGQTPNEDTTFEIEGYDDHINHLEKQYPTEEPVVHPEIQPEVKPETKDEFKPLDTPQQPTQQQPKPEAQPSQPAPTPQPVQQQQPEPTESTGNKLFDRGIAKQNQYWEVDELTGDLKVDSIRDGEGRKLIDLPNGKEMIYRNSLHKVKHAKEDELTELLKGNNLENKLIAHQMIIEDPELIERLDRNKDGQMTYSDFFDVTHLNEGKGLSAEEDAELTQEWLESLASPDAGARLRALYQSIGPGQDMVLYTLKQRDNYFNPTAEENWKQSGGGAWFDIGADWAEHLGSIQDVRDGIEKGDWNILDNWNKDSKYDDDLLQHKNPLSLEFQVNNPIAITENSRAIYETTYWGTQLALTVAAAQTGGSGLIQLGNVGPKVPALISTGTKFKNLGLVGGTVIDTVIPGLMRDFTKDGIGMMRREGWMEQLVNAYGEDAEFITPALSAKLNSPWAKRLDSTLTEGTMAIGGGYIIGKGVPLLYRTFLGKTGFLRKGLPDGARLAAKHTYDLGASTRAHSTKLWGELMSEEGLYKRSERQLSDLFEAGNEQLRKSKDNFKNAFVGTDQRPGLMHSTYGVYKNGAKLLGQGSAKVRSGIRQVLNDLDEIRHRVGIRKKGSTDSLFNQTQQAKNAKSGIPNSWKEAAVDELNNDKVWKSQLDEMNPAKAKYTRRYSSDSALDAIKEIMGRDAGRLSREEFWGKEFLDAPFKVGDTLDTFNRWAMKNIEVQDAVVESLLLQVRDQANAGSRMLGETDLFATDGVMSRISDNLVTGLTEIKKTQYTWDKARALLREGNGKLTAEQVAQLTADVNKRSKELHRETRQGVVHMVNMLNEQGNDELAGAILDVFKVSNDVHNWKDFDAWMRQKIVGGEFKGKVKTGELIRELQGVMVNSILSGPKTPLRALLGTTVNSYLNAINEAVGAIARAPFTGDIVSRKASIAKLKGMFEVLPESWDVFKTNWDSTFNADIANIKTRYNEPATRAENLWNAKGAWAEARGSDGEKAAWNMYNNARTLNNNKLLSWSPRALQAVDDTFKHILARSRSKEIAMRQALEEVGDDFDKLTPEILGRYEDIHFKHLHDGEGNLNLAKDSFLNKQFKEVTLTSELEGASARLDKVFNDIPLIKPFYLFARTGINGLNFTYKNTPLLGLLHKESIDILRHTGDDFSDLAKYGIENAADLANARNLFAGRQAVGATVVSTISGLYLNGQLTGNGPADRQLRQNWINSGWKPNHIYVGDVGFDYTSLEPFNTVFSTIADIGDNMELMGSEWSEKRLQAAAFVIGRGLQGKTYMSGLDQLMQLAQNPIGPAGNKAIANIFNNSVPLAGMRNEFGKWMNPHMKELNSSMWDSIRNRNLASEALAPLTGQEALPSKHDLLNGKPIKNWNIIGRSFNAISPIQMDIRSGSPGRKLLLDSNYDLKSTTYAYGGYSFVRDARVRSHFQNAIGTVPIRYRGKTFKNVEAALDYLATQPDIKTSMADMKGNVNNPAKSDINPNTYPHNTNINSIMNQARQKAWAIINDPNHPAYSDLQKLKSKKDGQTTRTRENRNEILELSFPRQTIDNFPKN